MITPQPTIRCPVCGDWLRYGSDAGIVIDMDGNRQRSERFGSICLLFGHAEWEALEESVNATHC